MLELLEQFNVSPQMMRLLIGVLVVLAVVVFLAVFLPWLRDFRHEMRYINMEIQRNRGRERDHWIKRKRRLWLSILPFVKYR